MWKFKCIFSSFFYRLLGKSIVKTLSRMRFQSSMLTSPSRWIWQKPSCNIVVSLQKNRSFCLNISISWETYEMRIPIAFPHHSVCAISIVMVNRTHIELLLSFIEHRKYYGVVHPTYLTITKMYEELKNVVDQVRYSIYYWNEMSNSSSLEKCLCWHNRCEWTIFIIIFIGLRFILLI